MFDTSTFTSSVHRLAGKLGGFHGFLSMLSFLNAYFFSSDTVCHNFYELVCGIRELGWALPTCKVGQERQEEGRSKSWKQVWPDWEPSEGAKLVKAERIFGVGFLLVVREESDQSRSHRAKKAEASL